MIAIDKAIEALEVGWPATLVTIVDVKGSTPREQFARLLVTRDKAHDTIGGGVLEQMAIDRARMHLGEAGDKLVAHDYPLGPEIGQCCGGHIRLVYDRLQESDLVWLGEWRNASRSRAPKTFCLKADGVVYPETVFDRRRPVWVFGAGHVARALVEILEKLPFKAIVVDERAEWLEGLSSPDVESHHDILPEKQVRNMQAGDVALVMTHSHCRDFDIVEAALERDDLALVGMIGSATKKARCIGELRERGVQDAVIKRLRCPIGVSGIDSKAPHAIAVSIASELLQLPEYDKIDQDVFEEIIEVGS